MSAVAASVNVSVTPVNGVAVALVSVTVAATSAVCSNNFSLCARTCYSHSEQCYSLRVPEAVRQGSPYSQLVVSQQALQHNAA